MDVSWASVPTALFRNCLVMRRRRSNSPGLPRMMWMYSINAETTARSDRIRSVDRSSKQLGYVGCHAGVPRSRRPPITRPYTDKSFSHTPHKFPPKCPLRSTPTTTSATTYTHDHNAHHVRPRRRQPACLRPCPLHAELPFGARRLLR
jgi:hypothetical protein